MKQSLPKIQLNYGSFIKGRFLLIFLKSAFAKKNILLSEIYLNNMDSKNFLILKIFYRHKKIKFFRHRIKKLKKKFKIKFNSILFKQLLKKNLNYIEFYNLNKKINLTIVKDFLHSFKKFKNLLFTRRTDLFSDFINTSSLLVEGFIGSRPYLLILTQIFSIILKKKHTPYFLFLNLLIKKLITQTKSQKNNKLKGIKFLITGRLKGKTRTNSLRICSGSVPCQEISANINFTKMHAHTRYGVFGLKLWIHFNKYKF